MVGGHADLFVDLGSGHDTLIVQGEGEEAAGDDGPAMHDNVFDGGLTLTALGGSGHDFTLFSRNEVAGAVDAFGLIPGAQFKVPRNGGD